MPYPAAPWTLNGHALQTLNLIDVDQVRPFIPNELTIVSVFPGKTLGGIYVANYGTGSILQYNELIVVAGLVSHDGKVGPWISHIYVDHPDSVAGGREIWGLPKELANFSWSVGDQTTVVVRQDQRSLCTLRYKQPFSVWRQSLAGQSFSQLGLDLLLFKATANLIPGLISAQLEVPSESPFSPLQFKQPWLVVKADDMQLTVDAPIVVGQMQQVRSTDRSPIYKT